jgi:hypothetical protein
MEVLGGYLDYKKKGAFVDAWPCCLVQFDPDTRRLTVQEGETMIVSTTVSHSVPVPAKPGRKPHRFDVATTDGRVASFSAPSVEDYRRWLGAFDPPYSRAAFSDRPAVAVSTGTSRDDVAATVALANPAAMAAAAKE